MSVWLSPSRMRAMYASARASAFGLGRFPAFFAAYLRRASVAVMVMSQSS
jgi:hypothetical protein